MPTPVLWGEDDDFVTQQMAEETDRVIDPNALLRIQPGWGHAPMVDDLAGLSATIERFIDGTMSGA
ncbi:MAG: hypothetical protein BSOLF_2819 [Candidatus Carbobacillus altaicus]|uniref:AB hydrolase-1 domain-containing protein n=1 Tax=Candidatus Carbonibacillus altaicus TaxID=2163959 RepID=A0A2R6Y1V8_9BACL|nr:MAG: hypothetical protein BSOLF_2819 [Candidatus Carbobacillus altaicus]